MGSGLLLLAWTGCEGKPSRSTGEEATRLLGSLYPGQEQVFDFVAPVPRGGLFRVSLEAHARADELGVIVMSQASGQQTRSHAPFENDQQRVGVVSEGGGYRARVYAASARLAGDSRARAFTLDVEALPWPVNDCCASGAGPGCSGAETLACVCGRDNHCCSSRYDEICVAEAIGECGLRCASSARPSNCCGASEASGCVVPEVEACVCGIDPYCCAGGFDQNCAHLAMNHCAARCSTLPPGEQ